MGNVSHYPGSLFIVAAPSGGGKTSLVKHLVNHLPHIAVSISHTTRNKRPGEQNGVDYFFVDEPAFMQKVAVQGFVEYAQVFGNYYGTSIDQITDRLQAGIDIVLDIDWQGALQIKRLFTDAVGIFIIPPSLEALRHRLMARQQDDEQVIGQRMQRACDEMSHYVDFDYLIVNDEFTKAASELAAIVTAHRLRTVRHSIQQRKLLSFMLSLD